MATLSGLSGYGERRKKPAVTYGKTAARNPTFSSSGANTFFDAPKTTTSASKLKRPTSASTKPIKETVDEFDIPLSEDEQPPKQVKSSLKSTKARRNKDVSHVPETKQERETPPTPPSQRKRKRTASHAIQQNKGRPQEMEPAVVEPVLKTPAPRRSKRQATVGDSVTSSPVSEARSPASPASPALHSPDSPGPLTRSLSTTPKQSKLWHELLLSDPPEIQSNASPPSASTNKPSARARINPGISRSRSDLLQVRTGQKARIVDRLKRNVPNVQDSGDSSEDDTSADKQIAKSQPVKASADSQTTTNPQASHSAQSQNSNQAAQSSFSQGTLGKKITYARSRTYLEDKLEDVLLSDLSSMIIPERPSAGIRRTAAPTKSKAKPVVDDDSDDGASQTIRNIHELRAAGHKNRFMDNIVPLLDDIKNPKQSSRSQRRSALIELANNLADKGWASRFVEYGFDSDLVAQFKYAGIDRIANVLLCVVFTRLLQAEVPDSFTDQFFQGGALAFLVECFGETKDVSQLVRDKRNNMSKVAQGDFSKFTESIRTEDFGTGNPPEHLTPCLLALKCTESLFITHRRLGHRGAVLSPELANCLVDLATGAHKGEENLSRNMTHLALSALEAASTMDVLEASTNVWSRELLSHVASALPNMLNKSEPSRELVLRLCLNVTNNHADNCDVFSTADTTRPIMGQIVDGFCHLRRLRDDTELVSDLDLLLMALGLMINLAESSDAARESAASIEDDGLAVLVDIFVRGREKTSEADSEEEMQNNIPYGYLAVLLGNMCQNGKVREVVRQRLPGQNLQGLLEAIDEFVHVNRQVDSQTMDGAEGSEVWTHFTERLSAMVSRLRECE